VIGTPTDNDVSLPGTDAQLVRDLTASPEAPLTSGTVILVARDGRLDDGVLAATAASLQGAEHVTTVKPPSTRDGSLSADGRTGWFTVGLDVRRAELTKATSSLIAFCSGFSGSTGLGTWPSNQCSARRYPGRRPCRRVSGSSLEQVYRGSGQVRGQVLLRMTR
jgi:putative drug exporter of the RND superfamily